ncbi:MAG: motility protein A [Acidimicrobiales bacterium]|nr:motility protein A [Acidimicrobiales bacterium]
MDPLTLIGLGLVFVAIIVSTIMDGNSFGPLIGPSSFVLVLFGALGAALSGYRMDDAKRLPKGFIVAFTGSPDNPDDLVTQLMNYAEAARREGILALEEGLDDLENQFLRSGLQMVVDGLEGEEVRQVMEAEIIAMEARHESMIGLFKKIVEYCPTLGMIGTVIGLINILGNLSDPSALGTGMALALLTTLYGVFFANVIFGPVAQKLSVLNELELASKELTVEGILAIREGATPRHLVERLEAYLQPELRIGSKARLEKSA